MAKETRIANRQDTLQTPETGEKPCVRASGLTIRRLVLGGCLVAWAAVLGLVLL